MTEPTMSEVITVMEDYEAAHLTTRGSKIYAYSRKAGALKNKNWKKWVACTRRLRIMGINPRSFFDQLFRVSKAPNFAYNYYLGLSGLMVYGRTAALVRYDAPVDGSQFEEEVAAGAWMFTSAIQGGATPEAALAELWNMVPATFCAVYSFFWVQSVAGKVDTSADPARYDLILEVYDELRTQPELSTRLVDLLNRSLGHGDPVAFVHA